jgi:hypothetical protein
MNKPMRAARWVQTTMPVGGCVDYISSGASVPPRRRRSDETKLRLSSDIQFEFQAFQGRDRERQTAAWGRELRSASLLYEARGVR